MTEGERVKAVRKAKGLTLEKFGESFGMSRSSISDIENGRRSLTPQTRLSICREFNVNENWLRTGEGGDDAMFNPSPQSVFDKFAQELHLEPRDRILIEKFLALSPMGRQAVMDYALSVAKAAKPTAQEEPKLRTRSETTKIDPAAEVPTAQDDVEALAQKAAAITREQGVSEKKPDAPASSANESAVG